MEEGMSLLSEKRTLLSGRSGFIHREAHLIQDYNHDIGSTRTGLQQASLQKSLYADYG